MGIFNCEDQVRNNLVSAIKMIYLSAHAKEARRDLLDITV